MAEMMDGKKNVEKRKKDNISLKNLPDVLIAGVIECKISSYVYLPVALTLVKLHTQIFMFKLNYYAQKMLFVKRTFSVYPQKVKLFGKIFDTHAKLSLF